MKNDDSDDNTSIANEDDDSDTSSDEELENRETINSQQVSTAVKYKEILFEEEDEVLNITAEIIDEAELEKRYSKYDEFAETVFSRTCYQDITPMFVDGTPFLIDGLSLLTCVLQDSNYNKSNGGQTLHFIYLCERIIELICRKGGTCEIIFFKDKTTVLENIPDLNLLLSILKIHLKRNTNIAVQEMKSVYSSEFINYVEEVHPCLLIIDFTFTEMFQGHLPPDKATLTERLFNYYGLFVLSLGLYCVDINYIVLNNNLLFSFVSSANTKHMKGSMLKDFSSFYLDFANTFTSDSRSSELIINKISTKNLRRFIALQVSKILNDDSTSFFIGKQELIKIYLLYHAITECLPLSCRTLKFTNSDQPVTKDLQLIIDKVVSSINICIQNKILDDLDCSTVADLWQGNLFVNIFKCVTFTDSLDFGSTLNSMFDEIIKEFNEISGSNLIKFPIFPNNVKDQLKKLLDCTGNDAKNSIIEPSSAKTVTNNVTKTTADDDDCNLESLIRPFGDKTNNFCNDILSFYSGVDLQNNFKEIIDVNIKYDNNYDWVPVKPLTDEFERIRDNKNSLAELPMKKQLKQKAQFAYYMTLYGSNLEGKVLEYEPIVVCDEKKDGSKKKQKKQGKSSGSSKKEEIIKQNIIEKQKKLLDAEKQKYDNFLKIYKSNKAGMVGEGKNLSLLNQMLLQVSSNEYVGKLLFYKVEVLLQLWIDEYKYKFKNGTGDLTYLKELFLAIRQVLYYSKKIPSLLSDSHRKKLGKILNSIGFSTIAERWNLPSSDHSSSNSYTISNNLSYIRFQLVHLGPELERRTEGQPDDRVTGFIPDPWQKKLFDIVDKNQSALIVAPTSSGKTYASYYCMKKVLKESNEGRVVYVAPTKALVNQVAATIFARFKNKNMPAGMSVFGIFTLEYRFFAVDCQILVTVPECLEMLLMSPHHKKWAKSLKYVIFDEVHCLAGKGGGITWERCLMLVQCPFLALSATIQNPREFWAWMSNMESYKKSLDSSLGTQVHLVVHSERHNDIIKYVFGTDNELHHIHPYAFLNEHIMRVHGGIPQHISLSPNECVELYDAMKISSDDPELLDLEPDKYFSKTETGFICRQEVREYEKKLTNILEKWFKEEKNFFFNTIGKLYEPLADHETGTRNATYFDSHIIDLIEKLRVKEMLPALIFSDNRGYCEVFGSDLASYFKDMEDKYLSQKKLKGEIMNYEDDDDIDLVDDEFSKNKKKKQTNYDRVGKRERRKRDIDLFPLGITNSLLEFSLRGKSKPDSKDLQFIERRLSFQFSKSSIEIEELRRGIGVHHGGITTKLRQGVEMLFRSKFLNVIFATSTLALGVHMPCKTVVILGDSPELNTLQYHQMSGRSGRRGFDKTGDVIFFGLDSNKTRILMTSKLPKMIGNFPLTVTTILRLLILLNVNNEQTKKTDDLQNTTLRRVLTVLGQGMLYGTEKNLYNQMKHFVLLSCHLLKIQRLIDSDCQPTIMAGIPAVLHAHEPGNLAFVYLLRRGIISKLCESTVNGVVRNETCEIIVNLLCRLFTKMPVSKTHFKRKCSQSVVKLPPLPDFVSEALIEYNKEIEIIYKYYYEGFCRQITETGKEDDKLPISGKVFTGLCSNEEFNCQDGETPKFEKILVGDSKHNLICSAFAGLSGKTDEDLYCQDSLVGNIRQQVFTDCKSIPLIDLKKPLNGYAYDFYRHGTLRAIMKENGLKSGHDFVPLQEFLMVLTSLETSLSELGMSYPGVEVKHATDKNNLNLQVLDTFKFIKQNYQSTFNSVYNITRSN